MHYIGAVYHVMVRGNCGQEIFSDDEDRCRFYLLLQEGVEKFGHRIHAFCLMSNHVHLAIQVGEKPLSRIMQHLCFRYTQWVNSRQKRVGHLFQGRYKAIVVDADVYLAELVRYIHLNPVRAKLVKDPEKYRWSGHSAYMGQETLPWLTTEWVLSQFAQRLKTARRRYDEFVTYGKAEGHREEFHKGTSGGRILGDDSFVERAHEKSELSEEKSETLDEIIERVGKEYGLTEEEMSARGRQRHPAEARGMIAYLVREATGLSLTELARRMKRDVSTLSLAADKIMRRSNYQNKEVARGKS
jgi:REP element-mobilizing transposase RayT